MMERPRGRVARAGHNLPGQLTSFIGREQELAELKRLLGTTRIVTLVGAAGIGKTRLAIQAAQLAASAEGAWFVELAALSEPALVPHAVASAFDVREQPGLPVLDTLVDVLRPRRCLLVLDNCEHLVNACALVAERLLHGCPGLSLLTTSREPLGFSGETVWRVPPLSVPTTADVQTSQLLFRSTSLNSQHEAVRLFLERARSVSATFGLTEQNAPAVAQICRKLDGIPLAIELAAPLVRGLSPEQIIARLDDRLRLLTDGSRTASRRHQTLLGAIDWSYDLLTDQERLLFRRLSVFSGGWSLEAAETVCAGDGIEPESVLRLLLHLVDKSLVVADDQTTRGNAVSVVRYRLMESLRQYGADKLRGMREDAAVHERHLAWCLGLAEVDASHVRGPIDVLRVTRLEAEHDNLRVALGWSLKAEASESAGLAGLRLAAALWEFWWIHSHLSEGRRWLQDAISIVGCPTDAGRHTRAQALVGAGVLAGAQREYEQAVALCEEGLALLEPSEDPLHASMAFTVRGIAAEARGHYDEATANFEQSLALARVGNVRVGWQLGHLGRAAAAQGEYEQAATLLEESLELLRNAGMSRGLAGRCSTSDAFARTWAISNAQSTCTRKG